MRDDVPSNDSLQWELKHGDGGLIDIEFLVQYTVLAYAHREPKLVSVTDNLGSLQLFAQLSVLEKPSIDVLSQAYTKLRHALHRAILLPDAVPSNDNEELAILRQSVVTLWQRWMLDA